MPTGPGSFDAQGVWQYGESDENPLGSDLLNRGMSSVSSQLALVRADLLDLQDPPDTGERSVNAVGTTPLPDGEAIFMSPGGGFKWVAESSARFPAMWFRVRGGHVYIGGACRRTGGTGATDEAVLRLPANARPSRPQIIVCYFAGVPTFAYIDTAGYLRLGLSGPAGVGGTMLMSAAFPVALA